MKTALLFSFAILSTTISYAGVTHDGHLPPVVVPYGTNYVRPNNVGGYTFYGKSGYVGRSYISHNGGQSVYSRNGYEGRTIKSMNGGFRYIPKY